jgi:type 1 glutamine amidotransferase
MSRFIVCFVLLFAAMCAAQPTAQPSVQTGVQPAAPVQSPAAQARPKRSFAANSLGGAAAGMVQNPTLDSVAPQLPEGLKPGGVLIFAKTVGYRDEPAMQASNAALAAIAHEHGWPYFITENGAVMNPTQLAQFKLVIWNNASGDPLTADQKAAFKAWVEHGGSFFGIHGAGGDPVSNHGRTSLADWKWYVDTLIGAQFIVHSNVVPGDLHIEDRKSPLTKGLPAIWNRLGEWYAFDASPRNKPGFHIIATVDEKSYNPGPATMGADHPLIWWHCVGKGHAVYSALGHAGFMYSDPLMIQLLDNAMSWELEESGKPCPAGK